MSDDELDAPPVPWLHGAAGITAGAFSMSLFYPLDLIRTRLHAQTDQPTSKLRGAKVIIEQEGIKGLYRGVKLAVAAHSIGWGMYLTFFRTFQQSLAEANGGDSSKGDFIAACGAACATATLVTPLNVLKTRTQLHDEVGKQKSVSARISSILKQEGPRAFLRGVGPQILLSSHTTIQVALYEFFKRQLWGNEQAPVLGVAFASGCSKAVASALCNPLEVCRTRLQDKRNFGTQEYSSMGNAFRTIWATEGATGLYRGVWVNMARVVPTTVVAFIVYEQVLHVMHYSRSASIQRSKPHPHAQ